MQPVPLGVYEIYVLGVGDAAETTFKSPKKMGQCQSDWCHTLLESTARPQQCGPLTSRLTAIKIELDWVPACEACCRTTVIEPQGLERICWIAARGDKVEVGSVRSGRQMCPLRIGYWGSDDAGDGEKSSKGDSEHIGKDGLHWGVLVENAEPLVGFIGARGHIRGYISTFSTDVTSRSYDIPDLR